MSDPAQFSLFASAARRPEQLLLTELHLVNAETATSAPGAIWVRDGVIEACGPTDAVRSAAAKSPAAANGTLGEVPLGGAYVAPGLMNMHNHLSLSLPGPGGDYVDRLSQSGVSLYMAYGARRALHAGVTTVRSVAERCHADFALREAIRRGEVQGPDIFTAGQGLVCTGGHGHEGDSTLECDGPDGFARGVRTQIKAGADLIKIMISGGIAGQHEVIATPQLTREEMKTAIEIAHAWGRKVTAHAGPAEIIQQAVELGLDCVEHGYELTDEVCRAMVSAGTALVPTLIVTRCQAFFEELGVPTWMQQRSLDAGPRHIQSYQMALEAGVSVMVGSDMPPYWFFEGTTAVVREMEHMSEYGLGPAGALRAATSVPARWLGIDDRAGSIAVGKQADLIAMDQNPLENTSHLRGIRWVMKNGAVVRDDRMTIEGAA